MKALVLAATFSVALFPFSFSSAALYGFPINKYVQRASDVLLVKVVSGRQVENSSESACSFSYNVHTEKKIRGQNALKLLTSRGLTVGAEYLLIVAEGVPWSQRRLGSDIPSGQREIKNCVGQTSDTILADYSEIFPVYRVTVPSELVSNVAWVAVNSDWLVGSARVSRISDADRIDVLDYKIDGPPLELRDYFQLNDIIELANEGQPGDRGEGNGPAESD